MGGGDGGKASPTLRAGHVVQNALPYDFDHHKCSVAIVIFFLINYTNSALSALQNAHTVI